MKLLTPEIERLLCISISLVLLCGILSSTVGALPASSISSTGIPSTTIDVQAATFDNLLRRSPGPRGLEKRGLSTSGIIGILVAGVLWVIFFVWGMLYCKRG
ncbi:hypothetical protein NA56DRAFT_707782 [Hyaloscypha hepaticicola]|uniref:Uncharacterized protein n=1 Tax=Hyaloscypha hepaticicola TaxID=2082293 RepID=A0A2J6PTG9_9HELO|nr:hypothetical protein NA56DRAFT_707782 [Hyaloscypha hepaticicola]